MSHKLKRRPQQKPPNVKKERVWIRSRGKFLTVRELVYNVHLLYRNGLSIMAIAKTCESDHRTVKKILLRTPEDAFQEIVVDGDLYVIASERALPISMKPDDYPFKPLQGPFIHPSPIDKADLFSVKERIRQMGSEYGVIDVYKLERVDLRAIEDSAISEEPNLIDLGSDEDW